MSFAVRRTRAFATIALATLGACSDSPSEQRPTLDVTSAEVAVWTAGADDVRTRILPALSVRDDAGRIDTALAGMRAALERRDGDALHRHAADAWAVLSGYSAEGEGHELTVVALLLDNAALLVGDPLEQTAPASTTSAWKPES